MNSFGYRIEKDQQLDYDKAERRIALMAAEREPTLNVCINCGTCAATCPAAQYAEFNFRQICLLVKRGLTALAKEQLNYCMMCGKCQLACPRGVNVRNAIIQLKRSIRDFEFQATP